MSHTEGPASTGQQETYLREIRNWVRFFGIIVVAQMVVGGLWVLSQVD